MLMMETNAPKISLDIDGIANLLVALRTTIANSYVPLKSEGNSRPLEKNDFVDFVSEVECSLNNINTYLTELVGVMCDDNVPGNVLHSNGNDFIVPLILLCGEHRKSDLWTSENNIRIVDNILKLLCHLCHNDVPSDILLKSSEFGGKKCGALLKPCLISLRPKLLKDTWKTYPAAVACFQWLLFQVKVPHLGDHLSHVLPTALILVDDFQTENQLCGVLCLQHIVENVTRAELGWYGQGDVVLEALKRALYEREPSLVRLLVPCLALTLDKLEGARLCAAGDNSWSRHDDVLEVVLRNMEVESRQPVRSAYMETLPLLLDAAGVMVVRWSKRLLRVLKDCLQVAGQAELDTAVPTLQVLMTYMALSRPRLHHHATAIFSMLLRLLYDVTVLTAVKNSSKSVVKSVEDCLGFLAQSAPHEAAKIAADVTTRARFNDEFAGVVDAVFAPFCVQHVEDDGR